MHAETVASIKFGRRCAKVANKKYVHETIDKAGMVADLQAELQMIDAEMKAMVDAGNAGGINEEFPKSLQLTFINNMKKHKEHKLALHACKQKIKAGGAGLEKARKYEESQVRNLQGILLRSMTTGVYTDPCPSYVKRLQRRIDIITALRGMGANVEHIKIIEMPLTLDHLMLGFEG